MKLIALALFAVNLAYAQTDIDEWVKTNRKQTTQSFKVYHWASRGGKDLGLIPNYHEAFSAKRPDVNGIKSEDAPLEVTPGEALTYFKKMSGSFHNGVNPLKWVIGHGLYAGIDPIQSIMYAGKRWLLMEISVDTPIYYLNVNKNDYDRLSKDEKSKLSRALKKYDISVLRYDWEKASFNYCGNRTDAYNFIRPELLEEGIRIKVFVEKIPVERTALKEYQRLGQKFAYMFQTMKKKPEFFMAETSTLKNWLDLIMPSSIDLTYDLKKIQEETFECSNGDKLN